MLLALVFSLSQIRLQDKALVPPILFKERDPLCSMIFNFLFGASYYAMLPYICELLCFVLPKERGPLAFHY